MAHLSLRFLGSYQAELDDRLLTFAIDKARALLAYLAVEANQAHSRSSLAALLWPDYPEENARTTLRHVLHLLRQLLGDEEVATPYLLTTRQTLQFNAAASHSLDVAAFAALLNQTKTHVHDKLELCDACLAHLRQAVELYRADFLSDLTVRNSTPFEEWLLFKREELHRHVLEALDVLARQAENARDYDAVRRYALRQIEVEPWREQAQQQLMRSLAFSNQRNAALAQYETYRKQLADELGIEPDPETRALYERIRAGGLVAPDTRPAEPAEPLPVQLPGQLTPFVGRERELEELSALLDHPDARLMTLVGIGGMGKTRLALETARLLDLRKAFADGIYFVSLAPITTADAVLPALAHALGVSSTSSDLKSAVLRFLANKQALLIFDNCEHVLAGMSIASEVLTAAPKIKIIATSRERLMMRAEQVYGVGGMDLAEGATLAEAAGSSAVRLFVQSVRHAQTQFKLTEDNVADVVRLCRLVHAMPLGIELAAAWVESLSLRDVADEIARSMDFLTHAWLDAPERQRSMRGVFEWSWQLLNEADRRTYHALSVFRGGFTREAAQSVAGASLGVLTRLSHKSLLQQANGRYAIHELLRQFAAEQLDSEAAEARHSQYYMTFVTARESGLKQNQPGVAIADIRTEIDNFRQAWGWAVAHTCLDEIYAATHTVWMFCQAAAPLQEQERLFGLAVEGLQAALDSEPAASARAQLIQQVLSKLLAYYARTFNAQGRHQLALPLAQRATQVGMASGGISGIEGEAMGYLVWGQALSRMSQPEQAHEYLQRALQLAQHPKPTEPLRDTEWITYIWLTTNSLVLNKPHQARSFLLQGQGAFITPNNPRGETTYLVTHADVDMALGEYDAARQKLEQALQIARQSAQPWAEGFALVNLGKIMLQLGKYSASSEYLHQGWKVMQEMGDTWQQAQALSWLSRLNTYLGAYAQAEEYLRQLADVIGSTHSPEVKFLIEFARARLMLAKGDHAQSLAHAQRGSQAAEQAHNRINTVSALILVGHSHAGLRQFAQATDVYKQALAACLELGNVQLAVESRAGLAALALAQGDPKMPIMPTMLAHVEAILNVLAEHPQAGLDEPFDVYLTCYRVLSVCADMRAVTVLQTAQRLLQKYAEHIHDDALRRSFEENVQTHRELLRGAIPYGSHSTP